MTKFALMLSTLLFVTSTFARDLKCSKAEQNIFRCHLEQNGKSVAFCASKKLSPGHGYVQYRYGTEERPEMEFPQKSVPAKDVFEASVSQGSKSATHHLSVLSGDVRYTVNFTAGGPDPSTDEFSLDALNVKTKSALFTKDCVRKTVSGRLKNLGVNPIATEIGIEVTDRANSTEK